MMAPIRHYTMNQIAAIDNQAMSIWTGYASGAGMDAWTAWFNAHEITDLPIDVDEAMTAYHRGDETTIVDHAQADYGGGREATDWYALADGRVYAVPTSSNPSFWPADDSDDVPEITGYDPCGGRYSDCEEDEQDGDDD